VFFIGEQFFPVLPPQKRNNISTPTSFALTNYPTNRNHHDFILPYEQAHHMHSMQYRNNQSFTGGHYQQQQQQQQYAGVAMQFNNRKKPKLRLHPVIFNIFVQLREFNMDVVIFPSSAHDQVIIIMMITIVMIIIMIYFYITVVCVVDIGVFVCGPAHLRSHACGAPALDRSGHGLERQWHSARGRVCVENQSARRVGHLEAGRVGGQVW